MIYPENNIGLSARDIYFDIFVFLPAGNSNIVFLNKFMFFIIIWTSQMLANQLASDTASQPAIYIYIYIYIYTCICIYAWKQCVLCGNAAVPANVAAMPQKVSASCCFFSFMPIHLVFDVEHWHLPVRTPQRTCP